MAEEYNIVEFVSIIDSLAENSDIV